MLLAEINAVVVDVVAKILAVIIVDAVGQDLAVVVDVELMAGTLLFWLLLA